MRDRTKDKNSNYRHGECVGRPSKLYYIHKDIVRRCTCPAHKRYADYGGRGIDIDPRWAEDIATFLAELGPRPSPRHSIDQEDNSKGYWPGNVRWATPTEQNRNTRVNRLLTFKGVTQTLVEGGRAAWRPCFFASLAHTERLKRCPRYWYSVSMEG